jgi:15-cis-phytoene synthase
MRTLYDSVAERTSKIITKAYSTSFSMAIMLLDDNIQQHIYNIYGFVRLGDEIVDTFHDQNKAELLAQFKTETFDAIARGFSLNPVLHTFQSTVREFDIDTKLIEQFLYSMEMDLRPLDYNRDLYEQYIVGSAEVVGLMCLKVFVMGDNAEYERLRYPAERLGSAFQKINFLRDLNADAIGLGRNYFPELVTERFDAKTKLAIEADIAKDFKDAFVGIGQLPKRARFGVYLAYRYYFSLFMKIKDTPAPEVMQARIRVSDTSKYVIIAKSYIRNEMGWLK